MSNTKKIASVAFTGAAATAATLMGGGPAFAAVSWHVRTGNNLYHSSQLIKAKLRTGTTASFKDVTANKALKCTKGVLTIHVSKSHSPAVSPVIGKVLKSKTTWSSCAVSGQGFAAHLTTSPKVIATRYNASNSSVSGKLSGIGATISGTGFFRCKATISGRSIPFKYKNTGHSFVVNSGHKLTLKVKSANNCLGLINAGNSFYFTAVYKVSTPADLTIKRS